MVRQFEKPEHGRKPVSGFLRSGAPCPLNPKEINRGDYCPRFFICSKQKKIDPDLVRRALAYEKKHAARSSMIKLLAAKLKKLDPAVCFSPAGGKIIIP